MRDYDRIEEITSKLGPQNSVVVKEILIGKEKYLEAIVVYIQGLVDSTIIDDAILQPLMLQADEKAFPKANILEFICKKYIIRGDTKVIDSFDDVIDELNDGKTVIFIKGISEYIIVNTSGGQYRSITEPSNEMPLRGTREGFIENLEVNISLLKRVVKDENLKTEIFKIGQRSKSDVCLAYIDDIVDKDLLRIVRQRIKGIDTDIVEATGIIEQFVERDSYSPFPQAFSSERPDRIAAKILEGRVAVMLSGAPCVLTYPAILTEFFQAPEDYYQRTLLSNILSIIRFLSALIVIFLSPIYLALISYNVELIPLNLTIPIAQSRQGIPLPPFNEILLMEIIVELLREGGLRLPPKIASTISIVGGIIIGNAAVESKVVSPTTLLIVGISTVASFVIPNYDMASSLRILRFPMLILADALGFLGIAAGYFFLMFHVFSMKSMGVPYMTFTKHDMQDTFLRYPLYKQNKRPDVIPNNDPIRQGRIGKEVRKPNGQEKK